VGGSIPPSWGTKGTYFVGGLGEPCLGKKWRQKKVTVCGLTVQNLGGGGGRYLVGLTNAHPGPCDWGRPKVHEATGIIENQKKDRQVDRAGGSHCRERWGEGKKVEKNNKILVVPNPA